MQLENILKMPNKIEDFLNLYKKNKDMPVILFGGGSGCTWFIKFMNKYSIPVACIVDKNKTTHEKCGIPQLTPEEAYEKYDRAIVVISAMAYGHEIEKSIVENKPDFLVSLFDPTLEVLQQKTYLERKTFFKNKKKELIELEAIFGDQKSKIVLNNFFMGAITSDSNCYRNSASDSQYFPDIIRKNLSREEVFVDVGAFVGDSIQEFVKVIDNKYKKIYAFEPDLYNITFAKKQLRDKRIVFYQNGVGKNKGKDNFYNENKGVDEGARIVKDKTNATTEVEIVKLDDVIKEKVTYIKMDIEGMELDALKGAENLITKYKPKLAISIYHKMEDILEIPDYIRNMNLGYQFYLRHYWNCNGTDTILFAI